MYTDVANHSSDDHGRSTGQIVGITLGSIGGGILVIIAVILLVRCCFFDTIKRRCGCNTH